MNEIKTRKPKRQGGNVSVPVSLPPSLVALIDEVGAETHLSNQDTIRQALYKGLPILKAALKGPDEVQPLLATVRGGGL